MVAGVPRPMVWGIVALVAAVLAACGGDDEGGASPPDTAAAADDPAAGDDAADDGAGGAGIDACGLLDGIDVDGLLGQPAGQPSDDSTSMGAACSVQPADGSGGLSLAVTAERPADNFETQRELLGVDAEVDGLGDAAFHGGGHFVVLDGERLVRLQVVRDSGLGAGPVTQAEIETSMATILGNLAG